MELQSAPYKVKHFCPPNFRDHQYQKQTRLRFPREIVWNFLNRMETFTKGQPFPFRVEFLGDGELPKFEPGVPNMHHGPLMLFVGEVGEMREPEYRDLQYYYGSHALTLRLIRPARLEFWLEEVSENETELTLRVDSYVRNGFGWLWTVFQLGFWSTFPLACRIGIKSLLKQRA